MQPSSLVSLSSSSPSFSSYSSGKLAEIAARVVREISTDSAKTDDNFDPVQQSVKEAPIKEEEEGEEEFEFAIVRREPISADEIFSNGQIRPVYPLFNTDLLLDNEELAKSAAAASKTQNRAAKPVRLPLGKLFSEDREAASCSSSEADEIENIPADSYCVWTPKKPAKEEAVSGGRCKKSSSTGNSSKRWKIRDLLYRSNSDGQDRYVFLSPAAKKGEEVKEKPPKGTVKKQYVKSRAGKDGDKRRSFLPYRPDLLGVFLP